MSEENKSNVVAQQTETLLALARLAREGLLDQRKARDGLAAIQALIDALVQPAVDSARGAAPPLEALVTYTKSDTGRAAQAAWEAISARLDRGQRGSAASYVAHGMTATLIAEGVVFERSNQGLGLFMRARRPAVLPEPEALAALSEPSAEEVFRPTLRKPAGTRSDWRG
ncbi:hypothetical protein EC845_0951 [Comamonas sp. BIGb0124]|uniref:hypothetical protein n=1 Tax=Comamonas sp. BIGb0124 TaxID=2485130 RepID=UPI000F4A0019|nr:hypothetical protein [Comamonas sp. BIGb0124]ROR24917.1 hypothetical protein EC845_0951 [Comamonas sp. BIGb0124]